jgi:hypothetical protein
MSQQLVHRTVRWKTVRFSIGLMLLIAGVGVSSSAPKHPKPMNVGMIALLASPQKYNGKIIDTIGFLHISRFPEDDSLWLHREDLQNSLWKDSFALNLTQKQREEFKSLNHTYVMVQGTLHSKWAGSSGYQSGTISDVTMVHGWSPVVPFAPKKK